MTPNHTDTKNETANYNGFHTTRTIKRNLGLDPQLFSSAGMLVFSHFQVARIVAHIMNMKRDLVAEPESSVQAGQLNGMGLIDEIEDYLIGSYCEENDPTCFSVLAEKVTNDLGQNGVLSMIRVYREEFPGVFSGIPDEDGALLLALPGLMPSMLRYWLTQANEAFSPYQPLFRHTALQASSEFRRTIALAGEFFTDRPVISPDGETLLVALRDPAIRYPKSIFSQLEYILQKWGSRLKRYYFTLLRSLDYIREETRNREFVKGSSPVMDFVKTFTWDEPERFSPDLDWMPRCTIIAKSTYVWLHQLSRFYGRVIDRLDLIPDEELSTLAARGFSGLWLIGLWERSPASKTLKHRFGNPEAIASAYSLREYRIAPELGGEEALENLRVRAWNHGIRLASDMVPNHTGLDSNWMIEHPDWFIQSPYPPYPAYTFSGENLSTIPGVEIRIEDHYYTRTDAAVVFERRDSQGSRYIYHGNDGTSMPWNDTAQLNYLNPEVRETVIRKIIEIARSFPIIRFDAAMTLAKRHYQRLWFPLPGSGGDIPSRSEFSMTQEDFDRLIPVEFWREVVDRVAAEAPDTLLLAEAFWLMEGYFVRTLGMHRVYNSAFMNMLKNEENTKYRETLKNVLEFNPEVLKRFVNFMNNPDEETAVAQFGKDDKYFGICTLMVTLPGLPMFGHGQIEGFTERYGMEYSRPLWDEKPDDHLVRRHEQEIFPLMRRRYIFADVRNFVLYDFITPHGSVNENVFAYSNRFGDEAALVIYNNKYDHAMGWVKHATAAGPIRTGSRFGLGDGLGLSSGDRCFVVFRDAASGLQYIRPADHLLEMGLYSELGAFKKHVFLDFRQFEDEADGRWAQLNRFLDGRGVPDLNQALQETFLMPMLSVFGRLASREVFGGLQALYDVGDKQPDLSFYQTLLRHFLDQMNLFICAGRKVEPIAGKTVSRMEFVLTRGVVEAMCRDCELPGLDTLVDLVRNHFEDPRDRYVLFAYVTLHRIGELEGDSWVPERSLGYLDEWFLAKRVRGLFEELGFDTYHTEKALAWLRIGIQQQNWMAGLGDGNLRMFVQTLLNDDLIRTVLNVHVHREVIWFSREAFEELIGWLATIGLLELFALRDREAAFTAALALLINTVTLLGTALGKSEYKVEKLLDLLPANGEDESALPAQPV